MNYRGVIFQPLQLRRLGIKAASLHQFARGAAFSDSPALKHDDKVRVLQGGHAVRHNQRRLSAPLFKQQIASFITESFRLREESEQLLEQAKAMVEQEIEQGERLR
jgi:hypothetical protein